MTYQIQREEYVAPICTVVSFKIEENIAQNNSQGRPEFNPGGDAGQDDDEEP
ncbi:MAG: hypothetical protein IKX88_05730 [Thermoguttaceae bacterium]|nr:hypothetical protein [Thermoguttaceae bacterium]